MRLITLAFASASLTGLLACGDRCEVPPGCVRAEGAGGGCTCAEW